MDQNTQIKYAKKIIDQAEKYTERDTDKEQNVP